VNHTPKFAVSILLALFILLTFSVHLRLWQSFDWETLTALQNAIPRWTDVPFSALTLMGSAEITGLIFIALVIFAPSKHRLSLILAFGAATLVEFVGKTWINQPITPDELVRYVRLFPLFSGDINPGFSFPSGHAVRTSFILIVLASAINASRLNRSAKLALYAGLILFEIVMLLSRVYLAEHWTTDVIGGALLGTAFALVALIWEIPLPKFFVRKAL
jgi:undecaprenyl-diphosphatase